MKYISTKGQLYITDYIIGLLIFTLFVATYYRYEPNIREKLENENENLILEAKTISVSLTSQGVPKNWETKNEDQILRIGLTGEDQTLDISKLKKFYNMSYNISKQKFSIKNEFFIFLRDRNGNVIDIDVEGKIINSTGSYFGEEADAVSRITRIVGYNNTLTELVIYAWR